MDKKKRIFEFLNKQTHAVIATVSFEGKPEAALVGFGEAEDLSLIFGTNNKSRKYANILHSPTVALTISTESISVQYEGRITDFKEGELAEYKKRYFTKTPSSQAFENAEGEVYLKIVPIWIRYTDFTSSPGEVFEITL